VFSPQDSAADDVDSDADPTTGIAGPIDLGPAEDDPTWDAGMYLLEPAIDIEKLTNDVQSDSGPGELIPAGSTVTWTYIVTNTGNTTLYDVVVTDSVEGFVCEFASLAVGATETCTLVGEAQEGAYGNLSDVVGTDILGTTVTDEDPSHYIGYNVGIDLEKFVQGRDADDPTGPYAEVGDPVRFTFLVHNTGSLDLANVSVTDDVFGDVCSIDFLEAGLIHICEFDVPAELGQHANLGSVTGQPVTPGGTPIGTPVGDTDPAHYIGWVGAIDIEKSTNGEDADFGPGPFLAVGDAVEWIYVVTNNSSVDLVDVTVVDDEIGEVCVIDFLAANGGTDTCSAQGTAILGQYDNIGLVEGIPVDPAGNRLTNIPVTDADPSHYVGYVTGIEIIKKVEGDDANAPTGPSLLVGTQALFTFDVTNTGSVELTDVAVTDDVYGDICVIGDLAAGETAQCELLVTVEQGQHTNVATAEGQPVDTAGNPLGGLVEDDDPANYFGAAPSIDIEKATNGLDSDDAPGAFILEGSPVTWTYVITNDGNVDLDNIVVTDNQGLVPVIVDQGDGDDILAIGEVWVYEAGGTAAVGEYANLGSVLGRDLDGVLVGDNDPSHYTGYSAAIRLVKLVEGEDANTPTGPYVEIAPPPADFPTQVTFSFEVFNDGSSDLVDVVVNDDILGDGICSFDLIPVDESRTCEVSADAVAGQHTNVATASGQPVDPAGNPLGGPLSDDDPANYFGWFSGIDLEKLTNGLDSDNAPGELIVAGSTVTWTYEVTNTGNVDLANVLVQDDVEGIICVIDLLAAGASDECSASGTAQPGQYANVADVAGTPVNNGDVLGAPETDVDPSHYFGTDPSIDISKNAEGEDSQTIEVGSSVTFTITVENTGNVPLTDVNVGDDEVPACEATYTDNGGVLEVGAIWVYDCTVDDVQTGFVNIAVVNGTGPAGKTVTDEDPSTVIVEAPGIDIIKGTRAGSAAGIPPGAVISGPPLDPGTDGSFIAAGSDLTWVYVVTNTGDTDLVNVVVSDDLEGLVCEISLLQVGTTVHCLLPGIAGLNEYDNVGTVDGATAAGFAVTDSDPSSYFGADPSIDLEKYTNGVDSDTAPGEYIPANEPVFWLYEVINTGNTDLVDVTIVDDIEGEICVIPFLGAGETDFCTADGIAELGLYANEGSVTATPVDDSLTPVADDVSDEDPSHYTGFTLGIDLEKFVNGFDADVAPGPFVDLRPVGGDDFVEVTFEFVVTNTGSLDLVDVLVSDSVLGDVCVIPLIAAGATESCDPVLVPAVEGQHRNDAFADGQPVTPEGVPVGFPIFDEDPA
ncbi:MAG: hypothetical protein KJO84_05655, partial [Acidimicrobiia bacterium]|nr:hypothetical protein [Acidimicrobiia bacterium]